KRPPAHPVGAWSSVLAGASEPRTSLRHKGRRNYFTHLPRRLSISRTGPWNEIVHRREPNRLPLRERPGGERGAASIPSVALDSGGIMVAAARGEWHRGAPAARPAGDTAGTTGRTYPPCPILPPPGGDLVQEGPRPGSQACPTGGAVSRGP